MLFDKNIFKSISNEDFEIEIVDEVTKLVNKKRSFSLTIDKENESHNIGGDIKYFKFYDNINPLAASGVSRISLIKPIYIIHKKSVPKTIYLNRTQKKNLMEFLNSKCKTPTDTGILLENIFQYLIYYFNKVMFNMETIDILNYKKETTF